MKFSNCGSDENGKISGGSAGDQTGKEYRLISTHSNFTGYFHHSSSEVRATINEMAIAAAKNDHIGYDQSQRGTFYTQLKKASWHPENITTDCEADCSSSTAAIVIGAGNRCGDSKLAGISNSMTTSTEKSVLTGAGFTYKSGLSGYVAGDILWRKGHTAIAVDEGLSSSSSSSSSSSTSSLGDKSWWGKKYTKAMQTQLGTTVDGEISGQSSDSKKYHTRIEEDAIEYTTEKGGSDMVRALQKMLKGYYTGDVDGLMGPGTVKAHKAWLKDKGYSPGSGSYVTKAMCQAVGSALEAGAYR